MNDFLKTLAPLLGTALGGPLGGAAATFIANKLGLDSTEVKAVSDVLNSGKLTPDQVSQIKLAEIDFQKFMESNKIAIADLEVKNVEGARRMKEATHSLFPEILSTLVTLGFFGILCWMMYDKSALDSQPLLIMLGSLGAAFGAVINFWLGSNKGSDRTKELLAQAQPVGK
jgi:hypothetical protein